jgi:hypothetical protein
MLLKVRAEIASAAGAVGRSKLGSITPFEGDLWVALSEIIPAALHTGRLLCAPGGIDLEVVYKFSPWTHTDMVIVIEDYDTYESKEGLENRADNIKEHLRTLIPDTTFDIRIRPNDTARSSGGNDPVYDGEDMSMDAAHARASEKMKHAT